MTLKVVASTEDVCSLPAATKLGQGNIFTSVCLSTGGVSASVHTGIYTPQEQTPLEQTPQEQTSQEQTPPGSKHPPGSRHPRQQTPPGSRHPPGGDIPTGSRLQHTVNERPVRSLLECILVVQFNVKSVILY